METLIKTFESIVPKDCIISDVNKMGNYRADTSTFYRQIKLIIEPENIQQIQSIVKLANQLKIALYPISSGHNWGYGTSLPTFSGGIVLSLKKLKRISIDEELGLLTIEPGVTQQELYDYFSKNNYPFLVPTTGAGPNCSIVGNALERGYGITPIIDHFASVMGINAILPTGEIYKSPLLENNFTPILKWGLGPYLDGLFSQGNIGIVTEMTFLVERKPDTINTFICKVKDKQFSAVIPIIRILLVEARGNIAGINLMHKKRVSMMSEDHSRSSNKNYSGWMLVGTIYGTKHHAEATKNQIKHSLKQITRKILFLSVKKASFISKCSKLIPSKLFPKLKTEMYQLKDIIGLFEGIPSEVSLRLSYYKNRKNEHSKGLDPALDGCGLLWYSPIIPIKINYVESYIKFVTETCAKYNIEPALTFTSMSSIAFDCTLPILYRTSNLIEEEKAISCYEELLTEGRKLGFTPYRLNANLMDTTLIRNKTYHRLFKMIRETIDTNNIIAPGRYE